MAWQKSLNFIILTCTHLTYFTDAKTNTVTVNEMNDCFSMLKWIETETEF